MLTPAQLPRCVRQEIKKKKREIHLCEQRGRSPVKQSFPLSPLKNKCRKKKRGSSRKRKGATGPSCTFNVHAPRREKEKGYYPKGGLPSDGSLLLLEGKEDHFAIWPGKHTGYIAAIEKKAWSGGPKKRKKRKKGRPQGENKKGHCPKRKKARASVSEVIPPGGGRGKKNPILRPGKTWTGLSQGLMSLDELLDIRVINSVKKSTRFWKSLPTNPLEKENGT